MDLPHKIKVGISSCLLGEKVRYDGGHRRDRFACETLSRYFDWVSVCPEAEVGMGIPRETVQLQTHSAGTQMVGTKSFKNWTVPMQRFSDKKTNTLCTDGICGYIFKKGSPSCGIFRVKVYSENGHPEKTGQGLFSRALIQKLPLLPVEEEVRLQDPVLRENFITRVFAYDRLHTLFKSGFSPKKIIAFHTRHTYLLMAHNPKYYKILGERVANLKLLPQAVFQSEYSTQFMTALSFKATLAKHENVLHHLLGYFKTHLDSSDRQDLLSHIHSYKKGLVPLIVPVTLINHYVRKFKVSYLLDQYYLNPHPKELMLRNHV